MNDLRSTIQQKPDCLTNREQLTGILMDCGLEKRTIQVMLNLHSCGIVEKIRQCGGNLSQTEVYNLTAEQESIYGTSRKFIEEGIRVWAEALGARVEELMQPKPIPKPEPYEIQDLILKPVAQPDPGPELSKPPVHKKKSQLLKILLKILFGVLAIVFASVVLSDGPADVPSVSSTHGTVGENIQWKLKDGNLTISGSGEMPDYGYQENAPWGETAEMRASITTVNIEDGITYIGSDSFYGYPGYENLTDVTIADSVKEIGSSAFMSCSALTNLKLPAALETIESHAFFNCAKLMDVDFPRTISYIGWQAFQGTGLRNVFLSDGTFSYMSFNQDVNVVDSLRDSGTCGKDAEWTLDETGLLTIFGTGEILPFNADFDHAAAPWYTQRMNITAIAIGEGITSIGDGAFYDCKNLERVSIPSSVNSIGRDIFAHCTSLTSITLPDSITNVALDSFSGCTALSTIQLPMHLTTIEARAFENCENLEKISLPRTIANIGANAFDGCSKLKSVTIPQNCTIEDGAFPDWVEIK